MSSSNGLCLGTLPFAGSDSLAGATECEDRNWKEQILVGRLELVLWSTKSLSFREGMRESMVVESFRPTWTPKRGKSAGPAMVPGLVVWVLKVGDDSS